MDGHNELDGYNGSQSPILPYSLLLHLPPAETAQLPTETIQSIFPIMSTKSSTQSSKGELGAAHSPTGSDTKVLKLDNLPPEILLHVGDKLVEEFDYEALSALGDVSRYMRQCIRPYLKTRLQYMSLRSSNRRPDLDPSIITLEYAYKVGTFLIRNRGCLSFVEHLFISLPRNYWLDEFLNETQNCFEREVWQFLERKALQHSQEVFKRSFAWHCLQALASLVHVRTKTCIWSDHLGNAQVYLRLFERPPCNRLGFGWAVQMRSKRRRWCDEPPEQITLPIVHSSYTVDDSSFVASTWTDTYRLSEHTGACVLDPMILIESEAERIPHPDRPESRLTTFEKYFGGGRSHRKRFQIIADHLLSILESGIGSVSDGRRFRSVSWKELEGHPLCDILNIERRDLDRS